MKKIAYYIFRCTIALFRFIPFWLVYKISDVIFILFYYGVKYRRKVVRKNLEESFPEKTNKEIAAVEKGFFKHFIDIIFESLKGFSMSENERIRRYKVINPELLDNYKDKRRNVLLLGCHYGNWEWGPVSANLQVSTQIVCIYKTIQNPYIDEYVRKTRARAATLLKPLTETAKTFKEFNKKATTFALLADQSPSNMRDSYWVKFLGRETAVLHGPAKYSKKYDLPVVFMYLQKLARGKYTITGKILVNQPQQHSAEEISAIYMKALEEMILDRPELWLWSHRRWKRKRPEDKKVFNLVDPIQKKI